MSGNYTYGANISYADGSDADGDTTFDGYGQYSARTPLPANLAARLAQPNARLQVLVTVTARIHLVAPEPVSLNLRHYYEMPSDIQGYPETGGAVGGSNRLIAVYYNDGSKTFPKTPSGGGLGWQFNPANSQTLTVTPPTASAVHSFNDTLTADVQYRFSRYPTSLRSVDWEPRLVTAPNVSYRIEPTFSSVGQIGGGTLVLANDDGFFDEIASKLDWDAGSVTIEVGADSADGSTAGQMAESDYQTIGTWLVDKVELSDQKFTLTLRERKSVLERQIPYRTYTREEFPNIADDLIGEPIQIAYGVIQGAKPVCTDATTKTFKVAGHQIRTFQRVKIRSTEQWVDSSFASVDERNGTFTLGIDWTGNEEVAVDFDGRTLADGSLMENPADIVADLLDYIGETNLDLESFVASRKTYVTGTDVFGKEVTTFAPSIYLNQQTSALDVIKQINEVASSFVLVDFEGRWRFGSFSPVQAASLDPTSSRTLKVFTEKEIIGAMARSIDYSKQASQVKVGFAERLQQGWNETVTVENLPNRYRHNLSPLFPEEKVLPLSRRSDALYWGQRYLQTGGKPAVKYTFSVPWAGFFVMPGDHIHVTHSRYSLDTVLEVYEASYDFGKMVVKFVCGDQRGWGDTFGFWLPEIASYEPLTAPLPDGLVLSLEPAGIVKVGTKVASWTDTSTTMNDAYQLTVNNQPTHNDGSGTNRNWAYGRWTGTTQHMLFSKPAFMAGSTAGEIFILAYPTSDPGNATPRNRLYKFGSTATASLMEYPTTGGVIIEDFGLSALVNTAYNPPATLAAWRLWNTSVGADPSTGLSSLTCRLDGAQVYTATLAALGVSVAWSSTPTLGRNYIGNIAAVYIYNRVLTTAERELMLAYISLKLELGLVAPGAAPAALLSPPPPWDSTWTDAQAFAALQNAGFWTFSHESTTTGERDQADVDDPRSYLCSRWW